MYDSAIANLPPLRPYPDDISLVCFSLELSRYRGSWQVSRVSLVGLAWSRHAIGCRWWLKAYLQIAPAIVVAVAADRLTGTSHVKLVMIEGVLFDNLEKESLILHIRIPTLLSSARYSSRLNV